MPAAGAGGVVSELTYSKVVSPHDQLWNSGAQWYFEVGVSALQCVERALAVTSARPKSILDMPCGHGRVCRMLRAAFPDAHITAADLDTCGVDFCAAEFGAEPVYSDPDLRRVQLDRQFDLIWCGSLFTHLEWARWQGFLDFFSDHLVDDGVLVFTTHGRQPIQWMNENFFDYGLSAEEQRRLIGDYAESGFGFVSPANQSFGISLSAIWKVSGLLQRQPSLKVVGLHEAGWAGHQDVFSCIKLRKPYAAEQESLTVKQLARNWVGRVTRRLQPGPAAQTAEGQSTAGQGMKTNPGWCPCCRSDTEFVETGVWLRDQYMCRRCNSIPRMRAINRTLDAYFPGWEALSIHESSPANDFIRRFAANYSWSFFFEDVEPGTLREGNRCENLEALTFADNTFDLFVTQDVFEHVFRPDRAIQEIMRVLRPGGAHVFTAPKHKGLRQTRQRARFEGGRIEHLLEEQYHGNPIGDGRSLVTWDYGDDFEVYLWRWCGYPTATYIVRDRSVGIDGEYLEVFVTRKIERLP
jgi:SAM-dependent methyltransferase